jgi:hypothetical protein
VDAAIQFHNQTPLAAAEINNVPAHSVLAAEFKAIESESPQQAPSDFFGVGFIAP